MILSYCSFNTEHVDWKKNKKKMLFYLQVTFSRRRVLYYSKDFKNSSADYNIVTLLESLVTGADNCDVQ